MKNIIINNNFLYIIFFLHPLIYIFDGDIYRAYEVVFVFIISLISLKSLNLINFKYEKRLLLIFYIFILIQQFFIPNRDFEFGIKFFITFISATFPFWLFENIKLTNKDLSELINLGINVIFYISLINYISSFLFDFGEIYTGGILFNKRAFGILGDSFTPILSLLQIYFISKKQFIKFLLSLFLLLITGGKAGILLSLFIIFADLLIKKKYLLKNYLFIFLFAFVYFLAGFLLQNFNLNELISSIEYSLNNRTLSFEIGLNYFLDSPLIGIGINKGLDRALLDSDALANFYGIENYAAVYQVQNNFLRLLSETGIIGISIIFFVFYIWFKKIIFCIKKTKDEEKDGYVLVYSISLWLLGFFITYQGIAWFVPGHPLFAWVLMFTTINNIFMRNILNNHKV